MKKYLILSLSLSLMTMLAFAQPKFASKVKKGIFSVNTYDKDGNLLNQGTAFYVGENGDAVADYRIFKGAHKAVAVGADGKQADVEYVAGADGIYNLYMRIQIGPVQYFSGALISVGDSGLAA